MTLDLDHLKKLAMASRDTEGDEWYTQEAFLLLMPPADQYYVAALKPATVLELIRLAENGNALER